MENETKKIVEFLKKYSFEDLMRSFFVQNLWLPNVSSPIKSQYLYVVLESIFDQLPKENKISSYEDFKAFSEALLPLIPSFPMMEDYLPENDWGDIKYFYEDEFYKIFYGGDLSNTYDYYYSFEVTHRGFDDYYREKIGRSVLDEFEFCMQLQDSIIRKIDPRTQQQTDVSLGNFETPSEEFWNEAKSFLDSFSPEQIYNRDLVKEYTKDFDSAQPTPVPNGGEFQQRAHDGKNCFYFFAKRDGKLFPVLPRKFFAVVFDKWGRILYENWEKIEAGNKGADTRIGFELFKFIRERSKEKEVFAFGSALYPDLKPHKTIFTTVFRSKDRLVLIQVIPPASPKGTQQAHLDTLVGELKEANDLFLQPPTRVALRADSQIMQLDSPSESVPALTPLILTVIPHTTTDLGIIGMPNDLVGEIMGMDQLVGIIDEMESLDEFAEFFEFQEQADGAFSFSMSSTLDRFGAFKDSHGILLAGADVPDMVVLDPHWGDHYRYKSLSSFWKMYPEDIFFGHPRSWSIVKKAADAGDLILNSRRFMGYVYHRGVGSASVFMSAPVDSLNYEQGMFTDLMMNSLSDALEIYEEDLKPLPFAQDGRRVHILFFPTSFVKDNESVTHLNHLIPTDEEFWKMDMSRLRIAEFGARVVFDEEKLSLALQDAKDRSVQVQLLIDVLKQVNSHFGDTGFAAIETKLQGEKTKPNRFRRFALKTKVSFPHRAPDETPEEKELKLANKKIAEIAQANKVSIGDYEGDAAKKQVNTLRDGLISFLNEKVKEYDFTKALPVLISNIDGLTAEYDRKTAMVKDSLDQEVDYQREVFMGRDKQHFLHHHKNYRYLVEKFVQLQPTGEKDLSREDLRQLLAYVDVLLNLYAASDFLHYGIYPARIKIESDFQVGVDYGAEIGDMQTEYAQEQAKLNLGQIGSKADRLNTPLDPVVYIDEIDNAFKTDLGFSFKNLVSLQQVLAGWTMFNEGLTEATYYSADIEEIRAACVKGIEGYDASETGAIVEFLTLDPSKILLIEGDPKPAADLPVWEYSKRATRYSLKPIIKIGDEYYWGAYSMDRSGKIWSQIADADALPAEINIPTVRAVLERGHKAVEDALQDRIIEIVKRSTAEVKEEINPHRLGLHATDIGDVDVFALLRSKNIILNIESKIIDQAFCNKDLQRISRAIFGRTDSGGSFVKGYLQKVEDREAYLKTQGKTLAERYWPKLPDTPKVVSIFVTQSSYWWTKYPTTKTDVHFIELQLLEDFIKDLLA